MVDHGENRPILDQKRFPLPESLENDEFLDWARSLDANSRNQLSNELVDWWSMEGKQRRPWIQATFEGKFLNTDPSLFKAIFGPEEYERNLKMVARNLAAQGLTLEEFEIKLRESKLK